MSAWWWLLWWPLAWVMLVALVTWWRQDTGKVRPVDGVPRAQQEDNWKN